MQFKKGAFEIENATVYPVAIRVSTANEKYVLYEYLAMHCALYSYACALLPSLLSTACARTVCLQYDPTFADAFWNSSVAGMLSHMIGLMTSWAVVVDVYYLPPLKRRVSTALPPPPHDPYIYLLTFSLPLNI